MTIDLQIEKEKEELATFNYGVSREWKNIAIISLTLLLITLLYLGGIFAYNTIYNQGVEAGANAVITSQLETGNLYYYEVVNNISQIKTIPIVDVCNQQEVMGE